MKYMFYEHDSGNSTELTTSVTSKFNDGSSNTNSFKTTITDEDDDLGQSLVRYCEPITKDYQTGILNFGLKLL